MSTFRGKADMACCSAYVPPSGELAQAATMLCPWSWGQPMRRREFITLIGGAAAWPLTASAQQSGKIWRVGFLAGGARPTSFEGTAYGAFLRGMRELGYAENRDYIVEWRFAEGRLELLPTLAEELVRSNVDVIVTGL